MAPSRNAAEQRICAAILAAFSIDRNDAAETERFADFLETFDRDGQLTDEFEKLKRAFSRHKRLLREKAEQRLHSIGQAVELIPLTDGRVRLDYDPEVLTPRGILEQLQVTVPLSDEFIADVLGRPVTSGKIDELEIRELRVKGEILIKLGELKPFCTTGERSVPYHVGLLFYSLVAKEQLALRPGRYYILCDDSPMIRITVADHLEVPELWFIAPDTETLLGQMTKKAMTQLPVFLITTPPKA